MLEIAAESSTAVQRQSGGSPLVAMISVEISHRTILPKRSGESRFAPQQYCYAASKNGVVPSLPLASRTSQRDESNDVQRDAA
jgi:hypothetical protein